MDWMHGRVDMEEDPRIKRALEREADRLKAGADDEEIAESSPEHE